MLLLVDLDGVVYRGSEAIPGVAEVLADRVARGDRVIYVTNNSRWHHTEYEERLRSMGAPVAPDSVVTSARATALAVGEGAATDGRRPKVVMVLGGPGLAREIQEAGMRTVDPTPDGLAARPDVLVVGVDFDLTYERLTIAARAVREGARFVATNRDATYPTAETLAAGAGAIVAAVVVAAGREPDLVFGKPEPRLFEEAARSVAVPIAEAVVIGDGLATDIAAATRVGARSVLMLTGVSSQAQVDATPEAERPTAVARDARALAEALDRLAGACKPAAGAGSGDT
ncbi:MAG: HAD-IIA family hydrolase [Chloroflexi bacterium]|nr:HAD-IIA family hydrolase [Chloroflexota bacterium]